MDVPVVARSLGGGTPPPPPARAPTPDVSPSIGTTERAGNHPSATVPRPPTGLSAHAPHRATAASTRSGGGHLGRQPHATVVPVWGGAAVAHGSRHR